MSRIIFVTGTDTGVGKTLVTASLLHHLRQSGVNALAMKPFCSGGTGDVDLLRKIQGNERFFREICPYRFSEPVAPLVASRLLGRSIELEEALKAIRDLAGKCEVLLVEGAGGVLAPLGQHFTAAEIIAKLDCAVVIVGRNQLGVLNHLLLTVEALETRGVARPAMTIVLTARKAPDQSVRSNAEVLVEWLAPAEVLSLPYLGGRATRLAAVQRNTKKIKKTLARVSAFANLWSRSLELRPQDGPKINQLQQKPC